MNKYTFPVVAAVVLVIVLLSNFVTPQVKYVLSVVQAQIASLFGSYLRKSLTYTNIPSNVERVYAYKGMDQKDRKVLPFAGSTVIRLGGKPYVFVGMGEGQDDVLMCYDKEEKVFKKIISGGTDGKADIIVSGSLSKESCQCAVTFDITGDGNPDLIVGKKSGIYVYHTSQCSDMFKVKRIYGPFTDREPTAISVGDYNANGKADLYISCFTNSEALLAFQFNNIDHPRQNILLENAGSMIFKDVTDETNAGGNQNTFTSSFVSMAGSPYPDIVCAHDTGHVEVLKNNGGSFTSMILNTPKGFWMGLGIGDVSGNGLMDIFVTNAGTTMPLSKTGGLRGDPEKGGLLPGQELTNKHMLMLNQGDGVFVDGKFPEAGFGWGCMIEDITLNGYQDILFGQNYIDLPSVSKLPGAFFEQTGKGWMQLSAFSNPHYAQTPLLVDLSDDGIKDVVWINMDGPVHAYLNTNVRDNDFISIMLPDKVSYLNATVVVKGNDITQTKQYIVGGLGFGGDHEHMMTFGFGKYDSDFLPSVTVTMLNGTVITKKDIPLRTVISV